VFFVTRFMLLACPSLASVIFAAWHYPERFGRRWRLTHSAFWLLRMQSRWIITTLEVTLSLLLNWSLWEADKGNALALESWQRVAG